MIIFKCLNTYSLYSELRLVAGYGGKKGSVQSCTTCHGSGMQIRIHQFAPGMVQQVQTVCHDCQGQGERINSKDRCKNCQGRKVIRERKILEVHIDKGQCSVKNKMFIF